MDTFKKDVTQFFSRDLSILEKEINKIPEKFLWEHKKGISNSCGVLAQHLAGNLNHYIGACLGDTGYERDRDREFTDTGAAKSKLIKDIRDTAAMVEEVLEGLKSDELDRHYEFFKSQNFTVRQFLVHLYGHLNYHLGQVNYLRRILTET